MRARLACCLLPLTLLSCAEDRVLPVASVCGDGVVNGSEECDQVGPGCVECRAAEGYLCGEQGCRPVCGDGVVVAPETCDPPDGRQCDSSCGATFKSEACDANGYWLLRQLDFSRDNALQQLQVATTWYVLKLEQTGETLRVAQSVTCGIEATGTVRVSLDDRGRRALLWRNPQDGRPDGRGVTRPPRHGRFVAKGGGCELTLSRHYFLRGGDDALLPANFDDHPELSSLPPLPYEPNPTRDASKPFGEHLEGAEDIDGDGYPGLAWYLTGTLGAVRNSVQRDWNEYGPLAEYPIPPYAIEFTTGAFFDTSEQVLSVHGCQKGACTLATIGSRPATDRAHRVSLRWLGLELTDPRVAAVIARPLLVSQDDDLETCARVRAALPVEAVTE